MFLKSTPDFFSSSPCFPHQPPLAFASSILTGILTFSLNYSLFDFQGLSGLEKTWHMIVDLTLAVLSVDQSLFTFLSLMILVLNVVWECFCKKIKERRTVVKIFIQVVTPDIWLIFFAVHMEFGKYGQNKVVAVKDGHGLLCSSVNANAVWICAVMFLIG